MKKRWNRMIVASLIAIVVELVILFVLLLPSIYLESVFSALEKGDGYRAQNYIDMLPSNKKDDLQEMMADFATHQCNNYLKGDITYKELTSKLSAINNLDDYNGFSLPYYTRANMSELIKVFESGVKEYRVNGYSNKYYDLQTSFYDIYNKSYSNSELDDVLENNIRSKYESFLNGELDYNTIDMYVDVAIEFYVAEPCHYAMMLGDELYYYSLYLKYYDQAKEYFESRKYFETVVYCDSLYLSENDTTGYVKKITDLRNEAYDIGKTFYKDEILNYADENNKKQANELFMRIQNMYGDELDYSEIEARLRQPWMYAYVEFVENIDDKMKNDILPEDEMPTYIYLKDLDADDIPELFLANDNQLYVYKYENDRVLFIGVVGSYEFAYGPYLISSSTQIREGFEGISLIKYEEGSWKVFKYAIQSVDEEEDAIENIADDQEKVYMVDNEAVSKEEWEDAIKYIMAYKDKTMVPSYDNHLENYESVIYSY